MKKLMTSTIILLPLLLLAILLVSGAITSLLTHIYVETVEFSRENAIVLVMTDEKDPPKYDISPEVTVLPLKATNRALDYSIDNEDLVKVDENGVVTAVFYGETYVTVTSEENSAAVAKRKIIVTDKAVHEVVMNGGYEGEMYEGETQSLSVTIYPKEAENKEVLWTSSDESILHVGANGSVQAVGAGEAVVRATSAENGDIFAEAHIFCHRQVKDLTFDPISVLTSSRTCTFPSVTVSPADADIKLSYASSDESIATVDGAGNISFLKEGHITVTVTATDFRGNKVEKTKEYTSTDGYFLPPLFSPKEYTVDYDRYFDGDEALPIPFAERDGGSYRQVISVVYTVGDTKNDNVLTFDEDKKEFRFIGPMPVGNRIVRVDMRVMVYNDGKGCLEEVEDHFVLNVLRDAKTVTVSHSGTDSVSVITTAEKTLSFAVGGECGVTVLPENHTNTLSYTLTKGTEIAEIGSTTGVLTFKGAGEVTVSVRCFAEGEVTAQREVTVIYAPVGENEKSVAIVGGQTETNKLLLKMEHGGVTEEGVLYFSEPADAQTAYSAEGSVSLEKKGGVWHIVPTKGGFATVTVTVTPENGEKTTYTEKIYVDRPVHADDLKLSFEGQPQLSDIFCTSLASVSYAFTVQGAEGAMAGKTLYLTYGGTSEKGTESATQLSGNIQFAAEYARLTVSFGVEYGSEAEGFGAAEGTAAAERTIARNATSVTVSYNRTPDAAEIPVSNRTLTFTTDDKDGASFAVVKVLPANHTETVVYSLVGESGIAKITPNGVLTFTAAGEATVKIGLRSLNGDTTLEKTLTVRYAPLDPTDVEIEVTDKTQYVVLMMNETKAAAGVLRYTVPAGMKAEYAVAKGGETVQLEEEKIVPKKGGFATVTVTVSPLEGEGETQTFTVEVYVDRTVNAEDLEIKFDGKDCKNDIFCTSLPDVPYTFTLGGEGLAEGKRLYMRYGAAADETQDDGTRLTGEVAFAGKADLAVTFGVKYGDNVKAFGLEDEGQLIAVERTLYRDADSVSVLYDGVHTAKIQTKSATLSFITADYKGASYANVQIAPANHTDTVSYTLSDSKIASLTGGTLTFTESGTVTVTIVLTSRTGDEVLRKDILVTYIKLAANEKDASVGESQKERDVLLSLGETESEGVLTFTEPEESVVEYTVEEGEDTVVELRTENGVRHIVPLGGGFATVKVKVSSVSLATFRAATVALSSEYTVEVYVDVPVDPDAFAVSFNGKDCAESFRTSRGSVSYLASVTDSNGSTAGKLFYVSYDGTKNTAQEGTLSLGGTIDFSKAQYSVTFGVEYGERAAAFGAKGGISSVIRMVSTSRGTLDVPPTVTYEGGQLRADGENALEFSDLHESITLTVGTDFTPDDFDLSEHLPEIEETQYVGVSVSADGRTVTLTANKPCTAEKMSLTVGNKTFVLTVTVRAKADTVKVTFGGMVMGAEHYHTLLGTLTFFVTLSRKDGVAVTDSGVKFRYDETMDWLNGDGSNVTADITKLKDHILYISSADGGAQTQLSIERVTLEEFALTFTVRNSEGQASEVGKIDPVLSSETVVYPLPADMQGNVTIKVTPKEEGLLGGFGTDTSFKDILPVTVEGWSVSYNASAGEITLGGVSGTFHKLVTIGKNDGKHRHANVEFSHFDLASIEFTGFDSGKDDNVYRGYQQVRVFAKHSDYGTGSVDYFRMPVEAVSDLASMEAVDPALLSWTMTSFKKETATGVVTSQVGSVVSYGGGKYTIEDADGNGIFELKHDGETVVGENGKYSGSEKVAWIDPFTEKDAGFVRIYFGDVGGLSETDVQNDYFGNFGEREEWTETPSHDNNYDGSGRMFAPSENAYTYLRVEAGDGAKNGVNRHFNFNVLGDDTVVNVFNATGYLNNKKIALHNNLYGTGEVPKIDAAGEGYNADQFLDAETPESFTSSTWNTEKAPYEKDIIYGNGYSVNLKTVNDGINTQATYKTGGMLNSGQENTSYGFAMGTLYNVTVKGTNEDTEITPKTNRMLFNLGAAYYSTLQNYSKLNPSGTNLYLKNTVLRYVANAAIQVWQATKNLYFENVVIDECLRAVSLEQGSTVQFYFKGFTDVLNYRSAKGMQNAFKLINGGGSYSMYFVEYTGYPDEQPGLTECAAKEYLEWFGNNGTKGKQEYRYYVNMLVTNGYMSNAQKSKKQCHYWNDGTSKYSDQPYEEVGIDFANVFVGMTFGSMQMGVELSTYGTKNTADGGVATFDDRDTKLLFTQDRYIRLLCQYIDVEDDGTTLIKNTKHIQWHMNRVYRDLGLIDDETDHITALKQSLTEAQQNGTWDGEWPDGTTLQQALDACPEAAALASMISETVLPSKRSD